MFVKIKAIRNSYDVKTYANCVIDTNSIVYMSKSKGQNCVYYKSMDNFFKVSDETYNKLASIIAVDLDVAFNVVHGCYVASQKPTVWQKIKFLLRG